MIFPKIVALENLSQEFAQLPPKCDRSKHHGLDSPYPGTYGHLEIFIFYELLYKLTSEWPQASHTKV